MGLLFELKCSILLNRLWIEVNYYWNEVLYLVSFINKEISSNEVICYNLVLGD